MTDNRPIGIFDSGLGGLTVLAQIQRLLPHEDLIYVADTAYLPYGTKPAAQIIERALAISEFLLTQQVKGIVVACNSATAAAITTLRTRYAIPIIGIEPAVKPAVMSTATGVVGILATHSTLNSDRFAALVASYGQGRKVLVQPCPGWVEAVERGQLNTPDIRQRVEQAIAPLLAQGVDHLVLGCTHYPYLLPLIRQVAGPHMIIIDPSPAVARQLMHRLREIDALADEGRAGSERFYSSGPAAAAQPVMAALLGRPVSVSALPA
ncbi:MAG: glutamate racemase [Gammaproteobacteria bacterium]|nr:glutamate racemase [Gammaproteobacteria bacterium]